MIEREMYKCIAAGRQTLALINCRPYLITNFVLSVFPAPLSPEMRIDWFTGPIPADFPA